MVRLGIRKINNGDDDENNTNDITRMVGALGVQNRPKVRTAIRSAMYAARQKVIAELDAPSGLNATQVKYIMIYRNVKTVSPETINIIKTDIGRGCTNLSTLMEQQLPLVISHIKTIQKLKAADNKRVENRKGKKLQRAASGQ